MIHYQLRCSQGHGFDGWFKDSASFDAQAAGGLLECPDCGDAAVARALMAPALPRRRRVETTARVEPPAPARGEPQESPAGPEPAAPAAAPLAVAGERMPDHMRAMLQRLRGEVEKRCDYVGPDFAEEARRIHRGEVDRRGIYGEATAEEAEDLAAEGIDIARIPWVPRSDA
jgi:hypothetical protein